MALCERRSVSGTVSFVQVTRQTITIKIEGQAFGSTEAILGAHRGPHVLYGSVHVPNQLHVFLDNPYI